MASLSFGQYSIDYSNGCVLFQKDGEDITDGAEILKILCFAFYNSISTGNGCPNSFILDTVESGRFSELLHENIDEVRRDFFFCELMRNMQVKAGKRIVLSSGEAAF